MLFFIVMIVVGLLVGPVARASSAERRSSNVMQPAPDELSVIEAGQGVIVVAGELDAATVGQLARRLSAPPSVRVIDLSGVTFIDASGLRVLVDATGRPANRPRLRAPSRPVVRLCEITGLTGMLHGTCGAG